MIALPMHPVGLGFLGQASRPLHLLPRLSDPLTRDADKVHRALQAGSVLRCGVAGQLRQPLQTGMQSISVVFHAHPTGMNISERELIWINNLKRKKICLMRTAYSEEEQGNDVQGTPYLT
jgi:hypothetical protein